MKKLILILTVCLIQVTQSWAARLPSGTTDQYIYFVALDATDRVTPETGLTSWTIFRTRNGAAEVAMDSPTVVEVDATNMPGVYALLCDEDMAIDSGDDDQEMVFQITHAGMAPVYRTIDLYRPKITLGMTASVESDGMIHADTREIEGDDATEYIESRTLASADYFDPATDPVATVTAVTNRVMANVDQLDGNSQSLLDLQDFADNAYDPASNTVQAVDSTGYNNVLHVGSGQTYATIAAAIAAANPGDAVLVHGPWTNTEHSLDIQDGVTLILARGVTLTGSAAPGNESLFGLPGGDGVGRYVVRGEGTLDPTNSILSYNSDTEGWPELMDIECLEATLSGGAIVAEGQASIGPSALRFHCDKLTVSGSGDIMAGSDREIVLGRVTDSSTAQWYSAGRFVAGHYKRTSNTNLFANNLGGDRLIIDGVFEFTGASTNGLSVNLGTVTCRSGGVIVPDGRPSLAGNADFYVSEAFAYDVESATAPNIAPTRVAAILADTGTGGVKTATGTGPGELQVSDGVVQADVAKWAGQAAATTDLAIKDVLAKDTEIMGFNDPTAAAIADEVRTELTTELAMLDAAVGTRASQASVDELPPESYFDDLFEGAPTFANAMDSQGYNSGRAENLDNLNMPVGDVHLQTPGLLVSTTVDDEPTSPTTFTLADGPDNDGALVGALVVITNDDNPAEVKKAVGLVKNYDGDLRTVTLVTDPGVYTIAEGDKVDVIATGSPAALWLGVGQ